MKSIKIIKTGAYIPEIKKENIEIEKELNLEDGYIKDNQGNSTPYYRTITVQDYSELEGKDGKIPEILKKVIVQISFKDQNKNKEVVLSTVKVKED